MRQSRRLWRRQRTSSLQKKVPLTLENTNKYADRFENGLVTALESLLIPVARMVEAVRESFIQDTIDSMLNMVENHAVALNQWYLMN